MNQSAYSLKLFLKLRSIKIYSHKKQCFDSANLLITLPKLHITKLTDIEKKYDTVAFIYTFLSVCWQAICFSLSVSCLHSCGVHNWLLTHPLSLSILPSFLTNLYFIWGRNMSSFPNSFAAGRPSGRVFSRAC